MAAFNYSPFFTNTLGKTISESFSLTFDLTPLLDIQRKNIQAVGEAQTLIFQGFQTLAARQGELLPQAVEEASALVQEIVSEGTPEEKAGRQADILRRGYEASLATWQELAEITEHSGKEAADVIHDRIVASLSEFKSAIGNRKAKPAEGKVHKKAA